MCRSVYLCTMQCIHDTRAAGKCVFRIFNFVLLLLESLRSNGNADDARDWIHLSKKCIEWSDSMESNGEQFKMSLDCTTRPSHRQRRGRGIQHCSTKMQIATERIRIRKVIIIEELRAEIAKKILNSIVKHKSSSPKKFLTILFIITYYGRRRSRNRKWRWRWRDGEIFRKWRDMKERHKHVLCDDKIPFRCASSWQRGFSSSLLLLLVTVAVVWRYAVYDDNAMCMR